MNEINNRPGGISYADYFRGLEQKYGNLPMSAVQDALTRAMPQSMVANPFVQNRRVKNISTLPKDVSKSDIEEMLRNPDGSEQKLRTVSNILEYTAYPQFKIRTTYQDLLTYHHYVYPAYLEEKDSKSPEFMREWRMMCKLEEEAQPSRVCRQIVGQCIRDGKVFYAPRVEVDKSHNRVRACFMQQLPQDYVKIVGFNNVSKYTVAFNLFYFMQPGTDYKQFGDLFEPYMPAFEGAFDNGKSGKKTVLYASVNQKKMMQNAQIFGAEAYRRNGDWYYWVTLPVDRVWCFEADDVKVNVVSPLTGLFLSMAQVAQYEQIQLELVQNPLVSLLHGEIETYNTQTPTESDPLKVSPTGRTFFETMFYNMLSQNNTSGIGIYSAPFKNMKLEQLAEAPGANQISAAGYEYAMEKSGMSALIPTNSEARSGVAQISMKIESRFAKHIYWQFERMMNVLMEELSPKWEWKFKMFGDVDLDERMNGELRQDMTLGILPSVFEMNALHDRTPLDDMSMSHAVIGLGVLEKRLPLITSYTAKQETGGLPPKGGRPETEGLTSDGKEQYEDNDGNGGGMQ